MNGLESSFKISDKDLMERLYELNNQLIPLESQVKYIISDGDDKLVDTITDEFLDVINHFDWSLKNFTDYKKDHINAVRDTLRNTYLDYMDLHKISYGSGDSKREFLEDNHGLSASTLLGQLEAMTNAVKRLKNKLDNQNKSKTKVLE